MNIELMNSLSQFRSAKSIGPSVPIKGELEQEFKKWISEMSILNREYINILLLSLNNEKSKIYEVGKSYYDSANCKELNGIITPYKLERIYPNQEIIEGALHVVKKRPYILTKVPNYELLDSDKVDRFITHNPYNMELIKPWLNLTDDYFFSISVFGKADDKDADKKINDLLDYSNNLDIEHEVLPTYKDNNYYYILNTLSKRKK